MTYPPNQQISGNSPFSSGGSRLDVSARSCTFFGTAVKLRSPPRHGAKPPAVGWNLLASFLVHCNGDKDLLKQLSEEMFLFDGDQIPKWSSVGGSFHPASMLARVATRRRFE